MVYLGGTLSLLISSAARPHSAFFFRLRCDDVGLAYRHLLAFYEVRRGEGKGVVQIKHSPALGCEPADHTQSRLGCEPLQRLPVFGSDHTALPTLPAGAACRQCISFLPHCIGVQDFHQLDASLDVDALPPPDIRGTIVDTACHHTHGPQQPLINPNPPQ